MKENIIKRIVISSVVAFAPIILFAQKVKEQIPPENTFKIDINWVLLIIAVILILPIYLTSKTLLLTIKDKLKNKKTDSNTIKSIGVIIMLLCFNQVSQAQTLNTTNSTIDTLTWSITAVIILEILLIVFFAIQTNKYLKPESLAQSSISGVSESPKSWFINLWNKMNSFKPLSHEADIDTGHNYDGIRELDNITPPWFTTGFILTIIFAGVYLYRYHVAKSAPLPWDELKIEMAQADEAKSKLLLSQANNIDENSVKMLGAADIAIGKSLFASTCTPCHQAHGGSMQGGVGPNLTDDYWIHGGTIKDVFKTIKYGWPEKGMISWKDTYSPKQIAQLASFVKSIKGTNPPGAKEPQGDLFKEDNLTNVPVTKDTTTTKK